METKIHTGRFRIPSIGIIIKSIILEAVSQLGWWLVSKMINIEWMKDLGILIIFLALVFVLGWRLLLPSATRVPKSIDLKPEVVDSSVLSHISRLEAVQLRQGKNYISLNYQIANTLSYDLSLMIGKASLVMNNESTQEWMLYPILIKKQSNELCYKDVVLGEKISVQTIERLKDKVSMRIKLYITYWDYEGKEYHFNTEETEIIAL